MSKDVNYPFRLLKSSFSKVLLCLLFLSNIAAFWISFHRSKFVAPLTENKPARSVLDDFLQRDKLVHSNTQHTNNSNPRVIIDRNDLRFENMGTTWNRSAVLDPRVSEHIFTLRNLDHVAVFKPLCFSAADGTSFTAKGLSVCSGPPESLKWFSLFCNVGRRSVYRELFLDVHHSDEPFEQKSAIQWIEGTTTFLMVDRSCGNLAHFAGRILMLHHVLSNIDVYTGASEVNRIVIIPSRYVASRFRDDRLDQWHRSLLSVVVSPANVIIESLWNFVANEGNLNSTGPHYSRVAHVVEGLFEKFRGGYQGKGAIKKDYICFRKAVVPGFLKGRFFVGDEEYPTEEAGWRKSADGTVNIPRDSENLRQRVNNLIGVKRSSMKCRKSIALLNRLGRQRVFEEDGLKKIIELMTKVAKEKGYEMNVVMFDGMSFVEQINQVREASIVVGIHGANLVNTMFLPALSVLIEVMPYGFNHEMYKQGGNAGLKYFVHRMSQGHDFDELHTYKSIQECIARNEACKVFYRDAVQLVNQQDLVGLQKILHAAISWCDLL